MTLRRRRIARLLLVWAIDAVAFWLIAAVLSGVEIDGVAAAITTVLSALLVIDDDTHPVEAMHRRLQVWVRAEQARPVLVP